MNRSHRMQTRQHRQRCSHRVNVDMSDCLQGKDDKQYYDAAFYLREPMLVATPSAVGKVRFVNEEMWERCEMGTSKLLEVFAVSLFMVLEGSVNNRQLFSCLPRRGIRAIQVS